jgi:GMP synthase (glutamine-hydrolysing)
MSHGDRVEKVPRGFKVTACSANSVVGAMKKTDGLFYGVQFHPEVVHTPKGERILRNFLYKVCKCRPLWTMRSFIETAVDDIRKRVDGGKVVCGISGGVDSAVTAVLVNRAVGDRLTCIFVDNGVLRKGEAREVF